MGVAAGELRRGCCASAAQRDAARHARAADKQRCLTAAGASHRHGSKLGDACERSAAHLASGARKGRASARATRDGSAAAEWLAIAKSPHQRNDLEGGWRVAPGSQRRSAGAPILVDERLNPCNPVRPINALPRTAGAAASLVRAQQADTEARAGVGHTRKYLRRAPSAVCAAAALTRAQWRRGDQSCGGATPRIRTLPPPPRFCSAQRQVDAASAPTRLFGASQRRWPHRALTLAFAAPT